jgi:hypothetical protein
VRQMGDRLSDAWEKKWHASGIEGKWEDIVREQKADEVRTVYKPLACVTVEGCRVAQLTLFHTVERRWSVAHTSLRID